MTWYDDMLRWLAEADQHERELERAYQQGRREGRLALGLQWPELRRADAVKRAYRNGWRLGRVALLHEQARDRAASEEGAA